MASGDRSRGRRKEKVTFKVNLGGESDANDNCIVSHLTLHGVMAVEMVSETGGTIRFDGMADATLDPVKNEEMVIAIIACQYAHST